MFTICLDYELQMSPDLIKENSFFRISSASCLFQCETMTDADYLDDLALLANALAQVKFLLHSLEQPAEGIDFYVNTNKKRFE